jgi:penicillin-binding protein 1A
LQKFADRAIGSTLQTYGRSRNVSQAAMVSMETDGAVRAVVGGADYGVSQFNRATVGRRQPGSSFKAFVYLNALQHGLHENSRVSDGPVSCGRWSPKNYSGGYRGAMTATTALKRSINTVAVKLSLRWGRDSLLDTVQKLGLKEVKRTCSMALGDTGITVMQNTAAYAVLANGGKSVTPYGILEIFDDNGNSIYRHDRDEPEPSRIFEPEHIEALNRMLQQVILSGTGRRAGLDFTHAAGKTGTSSSYRNAWFMGFTGQYVTGVWFGNDNYQPTNRVTGGNLPTMAWKQFMNYAHSSLDIPDIPGIPSHPQQIAERKRIAKENNSLAEVRRTRGMSDQTRKILLEISSTMKNAKRLATAVRLANPENTAE